MRSLNRTAEGRRHDRVLSAALPLGAAVGVYGVSYGVLAVAAGLSPLVATLSSVLVLAGGSQFAFVGVLAVGGDPLTGAVSGLMLNLRFLAFGFAIAPHLRAGRLWRRFASAYIVVDEPVALALGGPRREVARRFHVAGVVVVVAWIGSTALGAYGGALIGEPEAFGLDAAFPAGFLALLAPWLRTRSGRVAALVGVTLALALTPVAPPGVPIVAAALGAVVALRVRDADPARPDDSDRERPEGGGGPGRRDPGPEPDLQRSEPHVQEVQR